MLQNNVKQDSYKPGNKNIELYEKGKQRLKSKGRDKSHNDIEYEQSKHECTFVPDLKPSFKPGILKHKKPNHKIFEKINEIKPKPIPLFEENKQEIERSWTPTIKDLNNLKKK